MVNLAPAPGVRASRLLKMELLPLLGESRSSMVWSLEEFDSLRLSECRGISDTAADLQLKNELQKIEMCSMESASRCSFL